MFGNRTSKQSSKLQNDNESRNEKSGGGSAELQTISYDGIDLRVTKWFDNCGVTLLSTYESVNFTSDVSCFDLKETKKVKVTCPSIVTTYNKFMGGIDLLNGLLTEYILCTEYI